MWAELLHADSEEVGCDVRLRLKASPSSGAGTSLLKIMGSLVTVRLRHLSGETEASLGYASRGLTHLLYFLASSIQSEGDTSRGHRKGN